MIFSPRRSKERSCTITLDKSRQKLLESWEEPSCHQLRPRLLQRLHRSFLSLLAVVRLVSCDPLLPKTATN